MSSLINKPSIGELFAPCPGCGKQLALTRAETDGPVNGMTHPMPMCRYFEQHEVHEIVHEIYIKTVPTA